MWSFIDIAPLSEDKSPDEE